ncbi:unnamed protein product, partial [Polarella glacialis]
AREDVPEGVATLGATRGMPSVSLAPLMLIMNSIADPLGSSLANLGSFIIPGRRVVVRCGSGLQPASVHSQGLDGTFNVMYEGAHGRMENGVPLGRITLMPEVPREQAAPQ